jgi:hypothetical protein
MVKTIEKLKICLLLLLITNIYNQNTNRAFEKIKEIRNRLLIHLMDRVDQIIKKDEIFDGLQRDYLEEYGLMDYPTYKRDFYDSPKYAENEILYSLNLSEGKRKVVDNFYDALWRIKGKKWEICLNEIRELFAKSENDLRDILL